MSGRPAAPPLELALLGILIAAGAWLRFHNLDLKSLWFDEALTYHMVQGSLAEVFARNATENSAPPFYPLLVALVTGPGASEWALRAPAAIGSLLALPVMWLLARQFLPGPLALVPPLLVAIAPTQLEYAQQLREYSLAFTASALLLLAYQRFLDERSARNATVLAAILALGLLIQYGIALLAAGLALVALVELARSPRRNADLRLWFLAQLPAAAVAVFLLAAVLPGQLAAVAPGKAGYLADRVWDGTAAGLLTLLATPRADIVNFAFPTRLMLALTGAGIILWLLDRTRWRVAGFLGVPVGLTVLASLAGVYPFGGIRQDLFLLPLVYVAAVEPLRRLAAAAGRQWQREGLWQWLAAAALATVLAGTVLPRSLALLDSTGSEPMRQTVQALERRLALSPGAPVYVYFGAVPAFRYYWAGRSEPWTAGATHFSGLDQGLADQALPAVHAEIRAELARSGYLWLVVAHITDRDLSALLEPLRADVSVSTVQAGYGSYLYFVRERP